MELAIKHADQVVGHYDRWLKAQHPDPDSLRGAKNQLPGNDYVAPQAWRTRMPEELYPTNYVADRTIAYLEDHVRSGRNKPFYLQCSFPDPHHSFTPPGKYWDMYSPDDMILPASFYPGNHAPPPHVAWAQADGFAEVDFEPNDPFFASSGSWGQAYRDLWGLERIGAPACRLPA